MDLPGSTESWLAKLEAQLARQEANPHLLHSPTPPPSGSRLDLKPALQTAKKLRDSSGMYRVR